jgi:hypothetical protein
MAKPIALIETDFVGLLGSTRTYHFIEQALADVLVAHLAEDVEDRTDGDAEAGADRLLLCQVCQVCYMSC